MKSLRFITILVFGLVNLPLCVCGQQDIENEYTDIQVTEKQHGIGKMRTYSGSYSIVLRYGEGDKVHCFWKGLTEFQNGEQGKVMEKVTFNKASGTIVIADIPVTFMMNDGGKVVRIETVAVFTGQVSRKGIQGKLSGDGIIRPLNLKPLYPFIDEKISYDTDIGKSFEKTEDYELIRKRLLREYAKDSSKTMLPPRVDAQILIDKEGLPKRCIISNDSKPFKILEDVLLSTFYSVATVKKQPQAYWLKISISLQDVTK
jgi:hypothetical protein